MANKHLKKTDTSPQEPEAPTQSAKHAKPEKPVRSAKHAKAEGPAKDAGQTGPSKKAKAKAKKGAKAEKKAQEPVISLTEALTAQVEASLNQSRAAAAAEDTALQTAPPTDGEEPPEAKADAASGQKTSKPRHSASRLPKFLTRKAKTGQGGTEPPPEGTAPAPEDEKAKKKPVTFRRDKSKKLPDGKKPLLSHRDRMGAVISLIAAVVLLAATAVIWFYRDSFSPDGLILSADTAAVAREEYVFDAGSGEAFAAAGKGLAVANASGFELLDGDGTAVTSMVMQMENPAATGCDSYAVFYDLGGRRLAVARFDGTVEELDTEGNILSATVSEGGYLAVTTEQTGYRALVTVYDPHLDEVYEWYSSSAWVISAMVSPDSRKLAVLSYTASGSEVRFFRLNDEDQQASFAVEGTVLLDVHWFTSGNLCALSSEQLLFFNDDGEWENTYSFNGQYLVGYTFDGSNCAAVALSPYRAGTTATLVSLDPNGEELGTADVQSEIVCLTAADLEVMVLCSDGAVLYSSALAEKGRLNGLPGFKYGLLRDRGEALLIASNYAEVYAF